MKHYDEYEENSEYDEYDEINEFSEIQRILDKMENKHFAEAKMYTADRLWASVYTKFLCKHCTSEPMESVSLQDIKKLKNAMQKQGLSIDPFNSFTMLRHDE